MTFVVTDFDKNGEPILSILFASEKESDFHRKFYFGKGEFMWFYSGKDVELGERFELVKVKNL